MGRRKTTHIDTRETFKIEDVGDAAIMWPGADSPRHRECARCLSVLPLGRFKRSLSRAASAGFGYSGERRVHIESSVCADCWRLQAKERHARDRRPRALRMTHQQIDRAAQYGDIHPLIAKDLHAERAARVNGARARAQHNRWTSEWQAPFLAAQKAIIVELRAARNQVSYAQKLPGATTVYNPPTGANLLLAYAQTYVILLRQLHAHYGVRAAQVSKDPSTHWPVLREQPEIWDKHNPGDPAANIKTLRTHKTTSVSEVVPSQGQQLKNQLLEHKQMPAYRTMPASKGIPNNESNKIDPYEGLRRPGRPRKHPAPEEFRREIQVEAAGTSLEKEVLVPVLAPWWHPEAAPIGQDDKNPVEEARKQLQEALDKVAAAIPTLLTKSRFRYPALLTPLTTLDIPKHKLKTNRKAAKDTDALTRAQQGWHNNRAQRAQKGR